MPDKAIANLITRSAQWVQDVQNRDGGLPSDNEGSPSCTWTTSGLLWATWTAGVSFETFFMRRALEWVLSQRNDDRGIPVVIKGDPSITDATAQTALACCLALKESSDNRFLQGLEECVGWLLYARLVRGGWNWRPSSESEWTASTAYAVLALHLACRSGTRWRSDIDSALREGVRWLKAVRNRDGGWGAYEGDKSRSAITALVASTLTECDIEFDASAAIKSIVADQAPDGTWPDTVDRPTGHTVTRLGTANCLRALASCGVSVESRATLEGLEAARRAFDRNRFRYRDTDILSWPTRDYLLALTAIGARMGLDGCRCLPTAVAVTNTVSTGRDRNVPLREASDTNRKTSSRRIVVLHISDIHRSPHAPTSTTTLLGKLTDDISLTYSDDNRDLVGAEPDLAAPDLIVVSGDLTQRADGGDGEEALRCLEGLAQIVNGERDRVILIPGNHDINWKLSAAAYVRSNKAAFNREREGAEPYRRRIKRAQDGTYWQRDDTKYADRYTTFKKVFDTFYQGRRTFSLDRQRMYALHDFRDTLKCVVAGFNSCDEIDAYEATNGSLKSLDRRAFIDTDAIYNASSELGSDINADVVKLAVFHHNIRSVEHSEDFLDPKYLGILKRQGFAVGLHGHVHVASRDLFDPMEARSLPVIGAGSLAAPYTERPPGAPMGYNVIVVDPDRNEIWVHSRRHDEDQLVWAADYRWNGRPCFIAGPCWIRP